MNFWSFCFNFLIFKNKSFVFKYSRFFFGIALNPLINILFTWIYCSDILPTRIFGPFFFIHMIILAQYTWNNTIKIIRVQSMMTKLKKSKLCNESNTKNQLSRLLEIYTTKDQRDDDTHNIFHQDSQYRQ